MRSIRPVPLPFWNTELLSLVVDSSITETEILWQVRTRCWRTVSAHFLRPGCLRATLERTCSWAAPAAASTSLDTAVRALVLRQRERR